MDDLDAIIQEEIIEKLLKKFIVKCKRYSRDDKGFKIREIKRIVCYVEYEMEKFHDDIDELSQFYEANYKEPSYFKGLDVLV